MKKVSFLFAKYAQCLVALKHGKILINGVLHPCMVVIITLILMLGAAEAGAGEVEKKESSSQAVVDSPRAVVEGSKFTFQPVPEGTKVIHDFVIKNSGNENLLIEKVQTA